MKKKYMGALLAFLMAATTVFAPLEAKAAGGAVSDRLQRDGIETGEAVADPSLEEQGEQSPVSANEISGNGLSTGTESVYSYSGALAAAKPSKSAIANKLTEIYSAQFSLLDAWPSTTPPYSLGEVSLGHRQKAVESVNLMRMIAGLPDVYLYNAYSELTQYGAVVLAANDSLTHTPSRPAGMGDEFYENGYYAASHSNIAYGWMSSGYYDMPMFTLGYMDDSGANNVATVGHRRWILNPSMRYTGFGFAINGRGAAYSAMYAFDRSGTAPDYDFISWPASGNFPSELASVKMPWHVTLNPDKFDISRMSMDSVRVTITAPDGTTQVLSGADAGGDVGLQYQPYFTVNKQGYGVANAIIFRPGTTVFGAGVLRGVYSVTVSGLYEKSGAPATVSYNVDFFNALSYEGGNNDQTVNEQQVTGFVNRLYSLCFDRTADDDGLIYWKNALVNKSKSGAAVAQGFFFSAELNNRNLSDADFVELLYRVMMDRSSDASGKAYWMERLQAGVSREGVFKGFAESQEFTNVCNSYGITRGTVAVSQGRDRNTGLTLFVSRLYTKALGRSYDIDGLNDWCNRILDGRWSVTDAATTGFFHSQEFLNKNLSNEEYVKALYRTFLDREYDAAGLADWVGKLNSGVMTRDQVLRSFSYSREFANIMKEYGL